MKCDRCRKKDATIHLSEIVKDVKSEVHLCEKCAREVGFNTGTSGFSLSLPEMLTFLDMEDVSDYSAQKVCSSCGCNFKEYKSEGHLGCPECYVYLEEEIEAVMTNFYDSADYSGKIPAFNESVDYKINKSPAGPSLNRNSISRLTAELDLAVNEERYEDAAVIRDRISSMKDDQL